MGPKRVLSAVKDREAIRAKVLLLYDLNYPRPEIQRLTNVAKATVRDIINKWGPPEARASLKEAPKSGQNHVVSKRCGGHCCMVSTPRLAPRDAREILKIAHKNPKWGAAKIKDYWRTNLIQAISQRPPGAVIQVPNLFPQCPQVFFTLPRCPPTQVPTLSGAYSKLTASWRDGFARSPY